MAQKEGIEIMKTTGLTVIKKKGEWHCANCGVKIVNMPKWKQNHLDSCQGGDK